MKSYKGILYALLSSVAFGLMPIFAKFAYQNGSNPTTVLLFRFLLAALMLFVYLKYKKISLKVQKSQLIILFLIGFLGYTLTTQTLFVSYNYLGVGLATTLHFIYPAIVCIIGFIFFKDKLGKGKLLSLFLAGMGVYALIAFENQTLDVLGIALALFSGVTYGTTVIALGLDTIKTLDNRVTTVYVCTGATLGMLIYGVFDKSIQLEFNLQIIGAYFGISIISTIISILLFLKAIEIIGTASASILGTFEPIVSIVLGILFFKENLSLSLVIGTILILASTVILAKDKEKS